MRVAAEQDLAVVVRGAGTKLGWGHPPERVDLVLDTARMDAVVEHAAGDLIVVVGAGCRLADLQADPGRGRSVAGRRPAARTAPSAGSSRPLPPDRRGYLHGAVRDLLIGARVVRADGVVAHSGGKVVKNVAGYDVGKLLTGSYGTLGVITEVAFRLHPVPPTRTWVSVPVRLGRRRPHAVVQQVVHSQLVPTAVELDRPAGGGATAVGAARGHLRGRRGPDVAGPGAARAGRPPRPAPRPPWWGTEPFGGRATWR